MRGGRVHELNYTARSPSLAAEISTRPDHPGPAADATQPEELLGAWADGKMVRIIKMLQNSCASESLKVECWPAVAEAQHC